MTGLLAFLVPLVAGWFLAHAALAGYRIRPAWAARAFEAALGAGAGIAISSVAFFLLTLAGAASPAVILACDAALLAAGLVAFWRTRRRTAGGPAESAAPPLFRWNWLLALALAAGSALVLYGLVSVSAASPDGEWDAWSIWNLRAKFLAAPGDAWRGALSPLPEKAGMHPDYPLLLSGFVAMVWKSAADTSPWVPQLAGFLFLALVAALLGSALTALRGLTSGLTAGLVLLSSTSFLFLATMQYADLPLSFYCLASIALLLMAETPAGLALSGAFASFAAWTKNEGLAFAVLLTLAILAVEWRAAGFRIALVRLRGFLTGAAPVLLLVVCFKLFLAPASEPLFQQGAAGLTHKLADPARYAQIGKAMIAELYHFGQPWSHPLLLLAILALTLRFRIDATRARALRIATTALALVFTAYCGVYLVTPSDLAWHLQTSLPRLYGQLWPSALLLVFLTLNFPAAGAAQKRTERARK